MQNTDFSLPFLHRNKHSVWQQIWNYNSTQCNRFLRINANENLEYFLKSLRRVRSKLNLLQLTAPNQISVVRLAIKCTADKQWPIEHRASNQPTLFQKSHRAIWPSVTKSILWIWWTVDWMWIKFKCWTKSKGRSMKLYGLCMCAITHNMLVFNMSIANPCLYV